MSIRTRFVANSLQHSRQRPRVVSGNPAGNSCVAQAYALLLEPPRHHRVLHRTRCQPAPTRGHHTIVFANRNLTMEKRPREPETALDKPRDQMYTYVHPSRDVVLAVSDGSGKSSSAAESADVKMNDGEGRGLLWNAGKIAFLFLFPLTLPSPQRGEGPAEKLFFLRSFETIECP